jgi:hypothetical protein
LPYWSTSTVLFAMQLILVLSTVALYIMLTVTLMQNSRKALDSQKNIRESLILENRGSRRLELFNEIYQKVWTRYHVFFSLFISALVFRSYAYIQLRMNEIEDVRGLEIWDPIDSDLVYLMGIQEFVQNLVLLSYFYGVNSKINDTASNYHVEETDEFENHIRGTILMNSTLGKSSQKKLHQGEEYRNLHSEY